MSVRIEVGDCLDVLRGVADGGVESVVCDPPYELGFMGKEWDATGVAFSVEVWREVLRVLKPGGHLLAFGGTRTYHRMTCAIEDAGFEIRESIAWMHGQGFPKSKNLPGGFGTALKPAHEPITVARKPFEGTVATNVLRHGTGALNIDGCRVGTEIITTHSRGKNQAFPKRPGETTPEESGRTVAQGGVTASPRAGRWPANVILDESQAAALDAQSGDRPSGGGIKTKAGSNGGGRVALGDFHRHYEKAGTGGDSGGASRFFYVAKPSRKERGEGNTHPTVKPVQLMRYLVRLVTPPGGLVLDPFAGSGTTGVAAKLEGFRFLGIEINPEYAAMAERRIAEAA